MPRHPQDWDDGSDLFEGQDPEDPEDDGFWGRPGTEDPDDDSEPDEDSPDPEDLDAAEEELDQGEDDPITLDEVLGEDFDNLDDYED